MTIREAIAFADEQMPNGFTNDTKTRWLSQCDAEIWNDVMLLPDFSFEGYRWEEDADLDLLAPEAYELMYIYWLEAQMHKAYAEIAAYENNAALYNALRTRFAVWYADTFDPAHGGRMPDKTPPTVRQGETITLVYEIPVDSEMVAVLQTQFVAYGETVLTFSKSDAELAGTIVQIDVTQAQSLTLPVGIITVQAVGTTTDGKRFETHKAMKFRVRASIAGEVL